MYPIVSSDLTANALEWFVVSMTVVVSVFGFVFGPRG